METDQPYWPINEHNQLMVDNSSLVARAKCETYAVTRYGHGWTTAESSYPIQAGEALHLAQAVYLRTGSADEARAEYEKAYRAVGEEVDPEGILKRLTYENTALIYDEWLETHPLKNGVMFNAAGHALFQVDPELVEIGFQYPLDPRCVCGHQVIDHDEDGCTSGECECEQCLPRTITTGRIDALVSHCDTGNRMVLDWKTTGNVNDFWLSKFELGSQLSNYVWSSQKHVTEDVVGAIIGAIEFGHLPSSNYKCPKHGMPYIECRRHHAKFETFIVDRDDALLRDWRRTAIQLAERYRASLEKFAHMELIGRAEQEGMFNDACQLCELREWCKEGRPSPEGRLTMSPWTPFDLAEKAA